MARRLRFEKHDCTHCGGRLAFRLLLVSPIVGPPALRCEKCGTVKQTARRLYRDLAEADRKTFDKQYGQNSKLLGIVVALPVTVLMLLAMAAITDAAGIQMDKSNKNIFLMASFAVFFAISIGIFLGRKFRLKSRLTAVATDFDQQQFQSRDFFNF